MTAWPAIALLEQALRRHPVHDLFRALPGLLALHAGFLDATVRLADYRVEQLLPLGGHDAVAVPVTGSLDGAAFRDQRPVIADAAAGLVHVPLSTRGNRLGVLSGRVEEEITPTVLDRLAEVADAVAHAVAIVETSTDQPARARRDRRLTLAAEMQWELVRSWGLECPEFTIAGQLEPAYAVRGDNFDWSADPGLLSIAVTNGLGEGLDAALLTNVGISALRNSRRSGLPLTEQAALADQAVWGQHGGDRHLAALLIQVELATGRMTIVDAGSPRLWIIRGDHVRRVELEEQLPLGMFDGTSYETQEELLLPGDRLFVVSDGVYDSSNGTRTYGETSLSRIVRSSRGLPAGESVRAVLSDLAVFREHTDLDDDAVVVCLDWHGPTSTSAGGRTAPDGG
ncbi:MULTISPECIES: PP2C family protein-serine/threonine phosphatase [Actinoalloteichus]|uniref:Serine phosphatase RsbU, regulator of sigma subunit n=1 Tax=Actinoalloteichus fjordicus TaxID=1612552 RepID=A0AAC9LF51_9PSEU|nr:MULTISPECIES: PP2C family protein-serine/threonine phosphatase [Actinoalloteichus]APU16708.1 serine phosphatase RsbU, regulator of sigma subunit [Actinoalloteichus fjordicus]APU22774.1 serine phosphatase RsbU, regulator of sigma subunit [Actinoalloteichus sp. GBA129-24]